MRVKEINSKFIAIHTVAAFLMILGSRQLFMLIHARVTGYGPLREIVAGFAPGSYFDGIAICGLLGLSVSALLSLVAAERKEIHKRNVLLVVLLGFCMALQVTKSHFNFHHLVPSLADVMGVLGRETFFLLNAFLLFSSAFLLVLSKSLKKHFL